MSRHHTRSKTAVGLALAVTVSLAGGPLGAGGCAGQIDDPEPFFAAANGESSGTSSSASALVEQRCASCHDERGSAGLDLVSPGLRERLVGVEASTCDGKVLVEPGSVDGFFLEKLDAAPSCGLAMPSGTTLLTEAEREAVRTWLAQVIEPADTAPASDAGAPGGDAEPSTASDADASSATPGEAGQ